MKKLLCGAIAFGLMGSMGVAQAQNSISGSTNFTVEIPEILVLYHWDEAKLVLTAAGMTAANDSDPYEISDTSVHSLTAGVGSATSYTINTDVATTAKEAMLGNVTVTLQNAWAVRSISSKDVSLKLSEQEISGSNNSYTLKNTTDDSKTILITDAKLEYGTTPNIATGVELSLAPSWKPKMGNIKFSMDLSNVTHSGTYKSSGKEAATDSTDTFLLTLTGNTTP